MKYNAKPMLFEVLVIEVLQVMLAIVPMVVQDCTASTNGEARRWEELLTVILVGEVMLIGNRG